jgi:hypothetical protein
MTDDRVLIRHGGNSWLIARTDRDEADRDAVIQSAGQILCAWLNLCSPLGFRGIFQVLHQSAAGARLVIGAARPMLITIGKDPHELEHDPDVGSSAIERRVLALGSPWQVRADFDWQAGDTRINWPFAAAHVLGSASLNDLALDWLLLAANRPPPVERSSSRKGVHP